MSSLTNKDRLTVVYQANDAFLANKPITVNPHHVQSEHYRVWNKAFLDCVDNQFKIAQQASYTYVSGGKIYDNPHNEWSIHYPMWHTAFKRAANSSIMQRLQSFTKLFSAA